MLRSSQIKKVIQITRNLILGIALLMPWTLVPHLRLDLEGLI